MQSADTFLKAPTYHTPLALFQFGYDTTVIDYITARFSVIFFFMAFVSQVNYLTLF